MKRTASVPLLGLALLGLTGCRPDKANAPRQLEETPAEAPPAVAADASLVVASIDDAAERLAPALEDGAAAVQVSAQLRLLSQALALGDYARARAALIAARGALARAGATPDAGAIGLALDRAEWLLSAGGDASGQRPRDGSLPSGRVR